MIAVISLNYRSTVREKEKFRSQSGKLVILIKQAWDKGNEAAHNQIVVVFGWFRSWKFLVVFRFQFACTLAVNYHSFNVNLCLVPVTVNSYDCILQQEQSKCRAGPCQVSLLTKWAGIFHFIHHLQLATVISESQDVFSIQEKKKKRKGGKMYYLLQ